MPERDPESGEAAAGETVASNDDAAPGDSAAPDETGDIVIDAALRDLAAVASDDLDGHIEAAEALQRTLQGRLSNLGE